MAEKVNRGTQLSRIDEYGVPIPEGIENFGDCKTAESIVLGNNSLAIGGEIPNGEVDY